MKTLIIVPAYNEEESLERTISHLCDVAPEMDYVVVNDGSRDKTPDICREKGYPFINLPVNLGLTGAFQAGMMYALKHDYDCAIQFDADGQHRPEYLVELAEKTRSNDIVIGSRFVNKNKPKTLRMFGSNLIQSIIKLTTGVTILDPTSGFRAFNKRMIREMATGINYGPEPDTVSYLIKSCDAKVCEIPVKMDERTAGESYFNFKSSAMYMLRMVISILFIQLFRPKLEKDA